MKERQGRSREKFRVAIVGCGKIAGGYDTPRRACRGKYRTHAAGYLADRRFKLVAACDTDDRVLRRFCGEWKIPAAHRNLETMLKHERPDVVSVCVPTRAHRSVLEILSRYPIRLVFAEKPLTDGFRKGCAIAKLYRRRKIALAVNYLRRWCPNHQKIKQIIDSRRLGRLRSFDAAYCGDLLNIGSHLIDLVQYLAGEIAAVRGEELILKGGVRGYLQCVKQDRFTLQLLFDRGLVSITRYGYVGECTAWQGGKARVVFRFAPPGRGIDSAMKFAVGNLADHLCRRQALVSSASNALRTLAVCEAIGKSKRSGRTVRVSRSA